MIFITQLIYIVAGKESVFDEFERIAIPIIAKYNGQLMLRTRPGQVIEAHIEVPYEIHLISFESDTDFEAFKHDADRKAFLHLKDESVRSSLLIVGR